MMGFGQCLSLTFDLVCSETQQATDHSQNTLREDNCEGEVEENCEGIWKK